jgi:hypothetical protein
LGLDQAEIDKIAQMSRTVPTNSVIIDIDSAKTSHHIKLILGYSKKFSVSALQAIHYSNLRVFTTSILITIRRERETVGDFQSSFIVQTQELTGNIIRVGFATMLNDLQNDLK